MHLRNNSASYCLICNGQIGKMRHNELISVHTDISKAYQLAYHSIGSVKDPVSHTNTKSILSPDSLSTFYFSLLLT